MTCVNLNHPDFIKLANMVNTNPLILKSKVGVWMEKNNEDRFPTPYELGLPVSGKGRFVIPLQGNQSLYKRYNLLNTKGEVKTVLDNERTSKWIASLNQSPYYQFEMRNTPAGKKIFIMPRTLPTAEDVYFNFADPEVDFDDPDLDFKQVANNFSSYYNFKRNLLTKLEAKFDSYKILHKNSFGTPEYKKRFKEFQDAITAIKEELDSININDANNIFSNIVHEIKYLGNVIDKLDVHSLDNEEVSSRIDFLCRKVLGQNIDGEVLPDEVMYDGSDFANYDSDIVAKLIELKNKSKKNQFQLVKNLMNTDVVFATNKNSFTEQEWNNLTQELLKERPDINILQQYFLGINSNNDTVATTLADTTFQANVQRTKEFARPFQEALKSLDEKLRRKKFDLEKFIEKDADGIETGNIIHKFTRKYFSELSNYYDIVKKFSISNRQDKANLYAQKIFWLKNNVKVIDFRKLQFFKDLYGEQYAEHFTASEQEMEQYEAQLKSELGTYYNTALSEIKKKLAEYQSYIEGESIGNTQWLKWNEALSSPWIFLQNFLDKDLAGASKEVTYLNHKGNKVYVFNNSRYIEFVPLKTLQDASTGQEYNSEFYNKDFDAVEQDEDAYHYWENLKDLYSKHINPTYSSMGQTIYTMSYAKFRRSFSEEFARSKGLIDFIKTSYHMAVQSLKEMWYEKGYYNPKDTIQSNYSDVSVKQIRHISQILNLKSSEELKGMAYDADINPENKTKNELISAIARKQVLSQYSKDLTKITLALSSQATLHKARQETLFIAEMLLNFHKSIKDDNGKSRTKSIDKFESWLNTNILNKRAVERGKPNSTLGKDIESTYFRYLDDADKVLKGILEGIKKNGSSEDVKFTFKEVTYSKSGLRYFENLDGAIGEISREKYEDALASYIDGEIEHIGIPLTKSGILLGMMKVMINKALALNPISGLFNRTDGMFANMIRDNMGDYWTRGNLQQVKHFLAGANLHKFMGDRLSPRNKAWAAQMKTYVQLLDELSLFQDKKNELDRKDKESHFDKYKEKINPFAFAVDNPEFKNQSEVILSILMDCNIKDKEGNEYPFFDGKNFIAYKPGTLELKDEFKTEENMGWENFSINEQHKDWNSFFTQRVKIEDTVKRTQGNYATLDSIKILDSVLGRAAMMFMRWLPEHANQRFGTRTNDVIQGKKQIVGRYAGLMKNPGAVGIFGSVAMGATMGPVGFGIGATATVIPYILKLFYGKYIGNESIKNTTMDIKATLGFMQEILVQSINLPVKVLYSKKNLDSVVKNNLLDNNKNLTEGEVRALKGMAQETAVMLSQLLAMILLKGMLHDDDDDDMKDKQTKRMISNFIDNQGNRSINSLLMWSNPQAFINDNSKLALLRYIGDVGKLVSFINDYFSKGQGDLNTFMFDMNKVQPFIPIPNAINQAVFNHQYPGFDKKEYQAGQWFDDISKGQEWREKQRIKNLKKQRKEELMEIYQTDDITEKELNKKISREMRYEGYNRRRHEETDDYLDRIEGIEVNN